MQSAKLIRFNDDGKQSLGTLATDAGTEFLLCKTLELPWKNNLHEISCIPEGSYLCKWTRSSRMSLKAGHDVFTYEVLDVPDRAGIRIHSANFFHDLLGCIALGDRHKDINIDGELDVIHSGATIAHFAGIMKYEPFTLIIEHQSPAANPA